MMIVETKNVINYVPNTNIRNIVLLSYVYDILYTLYWVCGRSKRGNDGVKPLFEILISKYYPII